MKTIIAACTAVLVGAALSVAGVAVSASADGAATPAPTSTPAPTTTPVTPAVAPVITDPYTAVVWSMPTWINSTTPSWSQTFVSATPEATESFVAVPTTCGTQYQEDIYNTDATTTALIAGKILNGPNNPAESFPSPSGWGVTYELVQNAACPPPVVACTTSTGFTITGATSTSDGVSDESDRAPHQGATGYTFTGPGTVDVYAGVNNTATLNSVTSFGYTITNVSGQPAQLVLEVNPHSAWYSGGTVSSYGTLSTNLPANFAGGSVDALALTGTSAFSTTKIPSGPGSLSQPEPFSWFQTNFPNATLLQVGIHLLSGSVATDTSTVTAVHLGSTGHAACVNVNFVPAPPVVPTPPSSVKTGDSPLNAMLPAGLLLLAGAMFLLGGAVVRKVRNI